MFMLMQFEWVGGVHVDSGENGTCKLMQLGQVGPAHNDTVEVGTCTLMKMQEIDRNMSYVFYL